MFKPWLDKYPEGISSQLDESSFIDLVEMIEHTFKEYADHTAFINMDETLSYAELELQSRQIAVYLQQTSQLSKGDRVAIMMPNLLQYPIILLGILRAGLTVVNVNPLYTASELKHQLNDSGAKAIFIVSNFAQTLESIVKETQIQHVVLTKLGDALPLIKRNLVNFIVAYVKKMVPKFKLPGAKSYRSALKDGAKFAYVRPVIRLDDIAFIQYTGGTTGVSKGAVMSHRNMAASLAQADGVFGLTVKQESEMIVTALPLYHAFALTVNCLFFIKKGATNLLITNPRDLDTFIKTLSKYNFTYFTALNTLFNALLHHPKIDSVDFSHLKITLAGGMATQTKVASHWKEVTGSTVIEGYGLTECAPMVSVNSYNVTAHDGSIGLPMPGTDLRLIDDQNNIIEDFNTPGEIEIKGPQVMDCYWQNEEETKVVFNDGWFKSGDIGLFDEKGLLRLVDRKKDMILVSGFNVYPNEIEDIVTQLDGVLEAAVVGIDDDVSGEAVKLFVVLSNFNIKVSTIKAHCAKYLTRYKQPKNIEIVTELPKNNVGKVLRRLLKER
ncbi:long-chain-fatty-acid--CoA ligase [Psychromonas sp. RZ22]|uniref:AMP-binding protein n=1 Tax=Psychromonas algarum TaxID=2555643 RepID=UPI00106889DF|nr:AMP-binding protein [Psychromonas sp. RZ22]TEW56087.1 long-chain-fatty-acid--CoA ligase [Psychromonas sp. RZ22]